jgi:hypothetical protein
LRLTHAIGFDFFLMNATKSVEVLNENLQRKAINNPLRVQQRRRSAYTGMNRP